MIVDASAVLAILFNETDAGFFRETMLKSGIRLISAVNHVEVSIKVDVSPALAEQYASLLRSAGLRIVSVTPEQAEIARAAYARFGKGRHPARLNLGDCFAYALSRTSGRPLLFKGGDFVLTDVLAAR